VYFLWLVALLTFAVVAAVDRRPVVLTGEAGIGYKSSMDSPRA